MNNFDEAMLYLEELNKFGWKPGLERIEKLLKALGNPEKTFKSIHIGGTNGKGSVTVTISKVLEEQGYKVGKFISPEIYNIRERIQINSKWIPEDKMIEILSDISVIIDDMKKNGFEEPTNFEVWTAMCFKYFSLEKIDFGVIEVGLGGEIDSTNVINPLLSIITNVSIDHKDYLGDTETEIAKVKSGIIKKGKPVISGSTNQDVINVIEKKCKEMKSELFRFGLEFDGLEKKFNEGFSNFIFQNKDYEVEVNYSLVGHHQIINGSVALEAIYILNKMGFVIDMNKAALSLAKVEWAGRLEMIYYKGKRVLLDAAHNLEGAKNLALALTDIYDYRKLILMVGILADKERQKMIDYLGPFGDKVIVTKPNSPRADDFRKVGEYFKEYSKEIYIIEDVKEAMEMGISLLEDNDILCITGSIYMLQEIRGLF
ncbi:MAG: bifunctional folylpolyglutamate synthase/dihydrofolate synthase [Firmicutes bacterium]|nr:bifunctional folylpolyglutamate synthase/dihydrofolate synthase [Bacillota bacterium]